MALSIARQTNLSVVNTLFGATRKKSKFVTLSFTPFSPRDMFSSTSHNQILQQIVQKMQAAMGGAGISGLTTALLRPTAGGGGRTAPGATGAAPAEAFAPEQWQVDQAVAAMGGTDSLTPWLVDGKTKVDIDGRKAVVTVDQAAAAAAQSATRSDVDRAAAGIARFGFEADRLDGDLGQLRSDLRGAAAVAKSENAQAASAIDYALEDAFAALHQLELSRGGAPEGGNAAADADAAYRKQLKTNLAQAADVAATLGLDDSQRWGLDSLATDLAVFGKDLSAMGGDAGALAAEIKATATDMLADLESRCVGSETDFHEQRNRITGACARLVHGLSGGAVGSFDVAGGSAQVSVTIGGVSVNASKLVAMGNIVVDPLVLDLNGDGIDLSSAEDGVEFDMDGDGEKKGMGFIRGDDAFLFVDTHGDGVVHDGRQLFGNSGGYANGFEMLAQYDDNGDGVIDENDAIYDSLRLWQEKTEDGVCEAHETMSLREAGIKSIDLGYRNTREDDGKGNLVGQKGSFTRDDGSTGLTADVWLRERQTDPATPKT